MELLDRPQGADRARVEAVAQTHGVGSGVQQNPGLEATGVGGIDLVSKPAETVHVPTCGRTRGFDLHRDHISVVRLQNEVDFVLLVVTVVRQFATRLGSRELPGDLVDDECLKQGPVAGAVGEARASASTPSKPAAKPESAT